MFLSGSLGIPHPTSQEHLGSGKVWRWLAQRLTAACPSGRLSNFGQSRPDEQERESINPENKMADEEDPVFYMVVLLTLSQI